MPLLYSRGCTPLPYRKGSWANHDPGKTRPSLLADQTRESLIRARSYKVKYKISSSAQKVHPSIILQVAKCLLAGKDACECI